MRTFLKILLAFTAIIICSCEPKEVETLLSVSPASISFDSSASEKTVKITANKAWTAKVEGEGFSISNASGNGNADVTVSAKANESTDERTGKVTFTSENLSTSVELSQEGEEVVISVDGDSVEVPAEGGSFEIGVSYNTDYTVEVEAAAKDWLRYVTTKSVQSGKLEFSASANESTEERTGKVTVSGNKSTDPKRTITVKQKCKTYITIGETHSVSGEGEEYEVDLKTNADLSISVEYEGNSDWLTVDDKDGKLSIKAEYNYCPERKATLVLSDKQSRIDPVKVEITQSQSKFREGLVKLYDGLNGKEWKQQDGWCSDEPYSKWKGVAVINATDGVEVYLELDNQGLSGEIPDVFDYFADRLTNLYISELDLYKDNGYEVPQRLKGTLPDSFFRLKKLRNCQIFYTSLEGLPDKFDDMKSLTTFICSGNEKMTSSLPKSLGTLPDLTTLTMVNCSFTGSIPQSWYDKEKKITLNSNCLSGQFPEKILTMSNAKWNLWQSVEQKDGKQIDLSNLPYIPGNYPVEDAVDYDGSVFNYESVIKNSKYTVEIYWATWCPFSKALMPKLLQFYKKYHDDGLEVIALAPGEYGEWDEKDKVIEPYIKENGYDTWHNYCFSSSPSLPSYPAQTPVANIYDKDGNYVYCWQDFKYTPKDIFGKSASTDLISTLESLFGPIDGDGDYESTDYSMDGEVLTLQKASAGNGINIVLMGDGYTDKDMESGGTYETLMKSAADEIFTIEPLKSFRSRFNIYAVKAVSKNGKTGNDYSTAFSSKYSGSTITSDTDKCIEYALKVPSIKSCDNLLMVLISNYADDLGTANMFYDTQSGLAMATSQGNNPEMFGPTLRHEIGHAFAFLGDEYVNIQGTVPENVISTYTSQWNENGWWANIDFTNDKQKVKWAKFISDERYASEIGVYEGAALYSLGAYKPSKQSMMNENYEYFNAPSREAIYKRIMVLSGEEYSFEKFLEYDQINLNKTVSVSKSPLKRIIRHDVPPVVYRSTPRVR